MGGGLIQIVATGAQDVLIMANPQITFWKGLYKRHTNFAMESFRVNLTGQANWGIKHSAVIPRNADLMYSTYIEVELATGLYNTSCGRLGYNLIKYVDLVIGGQIIDRLYSEWLYLWDFLTSSPGKAAKLHNIVGLNQGSGATNRTDKAGITAGDSCVAATGRAGAPKIVRIPLPFFYTKNQGCALPLIALAYHDVRIDIQWNDLKNISGDFTKSQTGLDTGAPGAPLQASLFVDYIYLDVDERRKFAQESHEYLIEQSQYNENKGITTAQSKIDLTFNHPVKELVWVVQPEYYTNCSMATEKGYSITQPFLYNEAVVYQQNIQFNGQDRLAKRFGEYFNTIQPLQHHENSLFRTPIYYTSGASNNADIGEQNGVYMYSFALHPEEHQPSGSCNFSKIDSAAIQMSIDGNSVINLSNPWCVRCYALNYNILKISSGMAGLEYAN